MRRAPRSLSSCARVRQASKDCPPSGLARGARGDDLAQLARAAANASYNPCARDTLPLGLPSPDLTHACSRGPNSSVPTYIRTSPPPRCVHSLFWDR